MSATDRGWWNRRVRPSISCGLPAGAAAEAAIARVAGYKALFVTIDTPVAGTASAIFATA
jgi:hypothetical protein